MNKPTVFESQVYGNFSSSQFIRSDQCFTVTKRIPVYIAVFVLRHIFALRTSDGQSVLYATKQHKQLLFILSDRNIKRRIHIATETL